MREARARGLGRARQQEKQAGGERQNSRRGGQRRAARRG